MIDIKKQNNKTTTINANEKTISDSIRYILSHFDKQHELFPRTIMTSKTGGQIKVDYELDIQSSIHQVINTFKESDYYDCKINGFPYNTQHTQINLDIKNRTSASFIMIDLDLRDFLYDRKKLDVTLEKTLNKLSLKLQGESHPTVLWTGNGYHIYQPLDGIIFENYDIFYDFLPYIDGRDLTTEFLRFAEKFFTNGKADPKHLPSIKSCLVRVPGTFNSKNEEQVKIIQKWDGASPAIQLITNDFKCYLIQKRMDKINQKQKSKKKAAAAALNHKQEWTYNKINWIENLLQIPVGL
jgi:hypothetical protein